MKLFKRSTHYLAVSCWFRWLVIVNIFGSQLIAESKAESLERKVFQDLETAITSELSKEWNLARLASRALAFLDGEEKTNLLSRLREHLGDDTFVLRLLKSSVNVAFIDYAQEKRLFWDELVSGFGGEFPETVSRTIEASKELHLDTEDRETLELAQKYLDGWLPKDIDDL